MQLWSVRIASSHDRSPFSPSRATRSFDRSRPSAVTDPMTACAAPRFAGPGQSRPNKTGADHVAEPTELLRRTSHPRRRGNVPPRDGRRGPEGCTADHLPAGPARVSTDVAGHRCCGPSNDAYAGSRCGMSFMSGAHPRRPSRSYFADRNAAGAWPHIDHRVKNR
jgi:hypothetical protein